MVMQMKCRTTYKQIFCPYIHSTHEVGSKHKTESGHVAYQIKGNEVYSNIHAAFALTCTHSTPGMGSEVQNIFVSGDGYVAYQIPENEA